MKLLLATANAHKIRELAELLQEVAPLQIVSLRDFSALEMPEETGATMQENARIKAVHCAKFSGLPSLADDSGIEVDALEGAPGVHSARWIEGSDSDRTNGLLAAIESTPDAKRTARYRCAICLAQPDGSTQEVEAVCEGKIATARRGENGFGYDPIFEIIPETGAAAEYSGCTMAEVPPQIKAAVSHRARAARMTLPYLQNLALTTDERR